MMKIALVHPKALRPGCEVELSLNVLGVRALLDQEGIPYHTCSMEDCPADADVVIAVDHKAATAEEQRRLAALAGTKPMIWLGVPPEGKMMSLLGLRGMRLDPDPYFRVLRLRRHATTNALKLDVERNLKLKYIPYLTGKPRSGPTMFREIAGLYLNDGRRLGPGVLVSGRAPRMVVFPFALGKAVAFQASRHGDVRTDLDLFDYPLHTTVDSLRNLLRGALRWAAPAGVLARVYYWPARGNRIPRGCFCLNHDLCGFSPEGLKNIKDLCRKEKIRTTFFDIPPFRLKTGDADGHDVALHFPDTSSTAFIRKSKKELERIHGRGIRGWRRHGSTTPENWPRIWRNAAAAGIEWCTTLAVQTNHWIILSEATATTNRLPFQLIDCERGEKLGLLELPTFDSHDAERLADGRYGARLPWREFHRNVMQRMAFARRHNLLTGYLIHGWTAGVNRDTDKVYGATDAQRMMREVVRAAKRNGFMIAGHEELYDWWSWRSGIRRDGDTFLLPSAAYAPVLEIFPPDGKRVRVSLNGEKTPLVNWPTRGSKLVVLDPKRCGCAATVEITVT